MFTRNMNARITFFEKTGGQNEDGEVIDSIRTNVLTCWAEVSKTKLKEFKENASRRQADHGDIKKAKETKVFLIRYMPKFPVDNTMYIDFNGLEYGIDAIEPDYSNKDHIMVSGVRIV